jgi:hypothetical protein
VYYICGPGSWNCLELPGIAWNCLPSADDIFGDDPNTVYVRMNVSSENKKGFDMISLQTVVEIKFSNVDKMPWLSWDTPAWECKTGSKLVDVKGSVCSDCYACGGRYIFGVVKNANEARFEQLADLESWKTAFINQLGNKYKNMRNKNNAYFRWHSSGDVQSVEHLKAINEIALALPDVKFWLPTKEIGMVKEYLESDVFADNLCVRISMFMVNQIPSKAMNLPTSTVIENENDFVPEHGNICHATTENSDHKCGDCRNCWDKSKSNVAYLKH